MNFYPLGNRLSNFSSEIFRKWLIELHTSLHFSRMNVSFNFYVKRSVHEQDIGAKFHPTYDNDASVVIIFTRKILTELLRRMSQLNVSLLNLSYYWMTFSFCEMKHFFKQPKKFMNSFLGVSF